MKRSWNHLIGRKNHPWHSLPTTVERVATERSAAAYNLSSSTWQLRRQSYGSTIVKGSSSNKVSEDVKVLKTFQTSSRPAFQEERHDARLLVDTLLERTRSLMDGSKHHIVAYSGGIDSSLVACLIHQSAVEGETAHAVLGLSPAVPQEQIDLARHVAEDVIGMELEMIPTTEGDDEMYIENNGQACLACKTHLYTCLNAVVKHAGGDHQRLYNGTNADDLKDPTRLGLIAAENFQVRSPLSLIPKEDVRKAAKYLGLPNWNYAASPCLRSRLALGVEAVPEHLRRIETAERFVRQSLSLDATQSMRVRLLAQNRAMVEVEDSQLDVAESHVDSWQTHFQDQLGFASVAVRPFKSGSVATTSGLGSGTTTQLS